MNKRLTLAMLLSAILLPGVMLQAQPCADSLNIYTFYYQGRKYEIVKELKNWTDAADCAVERGGYLVQIGSQEEQDSVYHAITVGAAIPNTYVTVPDGGGVAYIWIGATDKGTEGTWLWDGNNDGVGTNFWTGQGAAGAGGGAAVGGAFVNWGGKSTSTIKEPDDYASNQDGAAIALRGWPGGSGSLGIPGEWNDIALTNAIYFIIEFDGSIGLDNPVPTHDLQLKLFPNPSTGDELNLQVLPDGSQVSLVEVFGTDGRILASFTPAENQPLRIPVSTFSIGIYYVKVHTISGLTVTSRFVRFP